MRKIILLISLFFLFFVPQSLFAETPAPGFAPQTPSPTPIDTQTSPSPTPTTSTPPKGACITHENCLQKGGQVQVDSSCNGFSCVISTAGCSFNYNTAIWECPQGQTPGPSSSPSTQQSCVCPTDNTPSPTPPQAPCVDPPKCTMINTALGDFPTDPPGFIKMIFGIILSLSGGIAVVLIMISGYGLMFSGGNPEKVQASREQLTAAIVGLLFIIFSMSILQIIGVDILHIPGLTK